MARSSSGGFGIHHIGLVPVFRMRSCFHILAVVHNVYSNDKIRKAQFQYSNQILLNDKDVPASATYHKLRIGGRTLLSSIALLVGPIPWGHSGPLCHALSLLLLLSWTSHAACAIAIAGVQLATPGDWQCNAARSSEWVQHFSNATCLNCESE